MAIDAAEAVEIEGEFRDQCAAGRCGPLRGARTPSFPGKPLANKKQKSDRDTNYGFYWDSPHP
ncbi:MAG: hypothetical protein OXH59_03270 [Rhodospirillaceae bacterium]|nr:hypothetical protein [Rhodospirillaceae bacterium]